MATMYVCPVCEKPYRSRSGLRRHMKAKHAEGGLPAMPPPVETGAVLGMEGRAVTEGTEVIEDGVAARVAASVVGAEQSEVQPSSESPPCSAGRVARRPYLPGGVTDKEAKTACKELGIKQSDVMAYKVYHEPLKVVIIEGPVGQKRVWLQE